MFERILLLHPYAPAAVGEPRPSVDICCPTRGWARPHRLAPCAADRPSAVAQRGSLTSAGRAPRPTCTGRLRPTPVSPRATRCPTGRHPSGFTELAAARCQHRDAAEVVAPSSRPAEVTDRSPEGGGLTAGWAAGVGSRLVFH